MHKVEEMGINRRKKEADEKRKALKNQKNNPQIGKKATKRKFPFNPTNGEETDEDESGPLMAQKVHVGGAREFSASTFLGLWVTIRSALGLLNYLSSKLGLRYFMTRRMNQDALEVR